MIEEVSKNGQVEFPAFLSVMARNMKNDDIEDEILAEYNAYDLERKGFITVNDILYNWEKRGNYVTGQEA